jgi:hypothetical protein
MGGRLMTKNQLHHRMMRGHGIDEEDENIYNEILESYNQKNKKESKHDDENDHEDDYSDDDEEYEE